eukprot:6426002-Amphidinium_carterae.1
MAALIAAVDRAGMKEQSEMARSAMELYKARGRGAGTSAPIIAEGAEDTLGYTQEEKLDLGRR